jgi:hypothetical protein
MSARIREWWDAHPDFALAFWLFVGAGALTWAFADAWAQDGAAGVAMVVVRGLVMAFVFWCGYSSAKRRYDR